MATPIRLRGERIEWREVDGEIVLLDLDAATYFAVNGSGAVLWHDLARGTTRDALVRHLTERFALDSQSAERDVDAFLEDCRRNGLLAS